MKGAGESGVGGALAAVSNAVADALGSEGLLECVPATPARVIVALNRALNRALNGSHA